MKLLAFQSSGLRQRINDLVSGVTMQLRGSALLVPVLMLLAGCHAPETHPKNSISGLAVADKAESAVDADAPSDSIELASLAFARAIELRANADPQATAQFLTASSLAWRAAAGATDSNLNRRDQAAVLYHASVRQLIEAAQQLGQIDPFKGITLPIADGTVQIPIRYHGFAWKPEDFNRWIPVDEYESNRLTHKHQSDGWGVPFVVLRERDHDEPFMIRTMPFAATVLLTNILRTKDGGADNLDSLPKAVLNVFNPLTCRNLVDDEGITTPIASDISAPVAWLANNTPHLNFEAFLRPDRMQRSGHLTMIEPYQKGKVPLILVHGLASDPLTWTGLINELRAIDWFNQRYQVWVFGYSTGRPFLRSAADLRRQCDEAIGTLTKDAPDFATHNAVMIGHSMGGLVTKLQVTDSDEELWAAFANQPLESLQADDSFRRQLSELFFFRPSPFVSRAIFIGTPHGGSPIAKELAGRLASRMVVRSHDLSDAYRSFLAENPGAIAPAFSKHIPTSVDMLEVHDPALNAIQRLQVASHVRLHSVIGNGRRMIVGGPADGTVPVESARHKDTDSELIVATTHRRLQSHPETVQEVLRILELHLQEPSTSSLGAIDQRPIDFALGSVPIDHRKTLLNE